MYPNQKHFYSTFARVLSSTFSSKFRMHFPKSRSLTRERAFYGLIAMRIIDKNGQYL